MGQKVNPHGLRVGVIKDWDSRWYASDAVSYTHLDVYKRQMADSSRLFPCPQNDTHG